MKGGFSAEDETCFIQKPKSEFRDVTENGAFKAMPRLLSRPRRRMWFSSSANFSHSFINNKPPKNY